jgi:hypothetical protein
MLVADYLQIATHYRWRSTIHGLHPRNPRTFRVRGAVQSIGILLRRPQDMPAQSESEEPARLQSATLPTRIRQAGNKKDRNSAYGEDSEKQ